MKMKKLTAMGMAALMAATMIPAVPVMAEGEGKVYYLNFKPEADEAWQNLAKAYTEETGTEVTVVTAASGQYETTLQSEMAKSDAPTLFQVNGPVPVFRRSTMKVPTFSILPMHFRLLKYLKRLDFTGKFNVLTGHFFIENFFRYVV